MIFARPAVRSTRRLWLLPAAPAPVFSCSCLLLLPRSVSFVAAGPILQQKIRQTYNLTLQPQVSRTVTTRCRRSTVSVPHLSSMLGLHASLYRRMLAEQWKGSWAQEAGLRQDSPTCLLAWCYAAHFQSTTLFQPPGATPKQSLTT